MRPAVIYNSQFIIHRKITQSVKSHPFLSETYWKASDEWPSVLNLLQDSISLSWSLASGILWSKRDKVRIHVLPSVIFRCLPKINTSALLYIYLFPKSMYKRMEKCGVLWSC
ncbi:hypothetical protein CDAR_305151 [Caerostris darwini]|uniref:Uncharacterized protein n=1 Tax=Caerostris darwini TaxID=1538125 RepID=A0AAV4RGA9_9ARAC|nr:hypothetical protein CDAR_305151 [Caerostris darwini]